MRLQLRTHTITPSSYTIVFDELLRVFKMGCCRILSAFDPLYDSIGGVEIWWGDPAYFDWSPESRLKVGVVLSEHQSFQKSTKSAIIKNCDVADILICPSESAAIAYRESPINTPVFVASFGVNPDHFCYIERDYYKQPFKFLHLAAVHQRKGSWMVPEAFLKAFPNDKDVALTIATGSVIHDSHMFEQLKSEYGDHPQIEFIQERVASAAELYYSHHVLVHPHLAEGFGLCVLEAMATGMPSIVSRCSAPLEFFNECCGWFSEMSDLYVPVNETLPDTQGFWRVPDVESLTIQMQVAKKSRHAYKEKAIAARQKALQYSWSEFVIQMVMKISESLEIGNPQRYWSETSDVWFNLGFLNDVEVAKLVAGGVTQVDKTGDIDDFAVPSKDLDILGEKNHALRVLDFGCGLGRNILAIKSYYPNWIVVGYDSPPMVARAKAFLAGRDIHEYMIMDNFGSHIC